jgi:predicted protein tyrosine phosphatase
MKIININFSLISMFASNALFLEFFLWYKVIPKLEHTHTHFLIRSYNKKLKEKETINTTPTNLKSLNKPKIGIMQQKTKIKKSSIHYFVPFREKQG